MASWHRPTCSPWVGRRSLGGSGERRTSTCPRQTMMCRSNRMIWNGSRRRHISSARTRVQPPSGRACIISHRSVSGGEGGAMGLLAQPLHASCRRNFSGHRLARSLAAAVQGSRPAVRGTGIRPDRFRPAGDGRRAYRERQREFPAGSRARRAVWRSRRPGGWASGATASVSFDQEGPSKAFPDTDWRSPRSCDGRSLFGVAPGSGPP